ncbi:hypothetical protein GUY44_22185 [Pimelobacter simplex]|uniref:hypothetical protein n=1 Tax=Nocardioides simplex TaxID=2045 RepID=UPI00053616CC|nr:hypothetical protein [Pimelobacter simplex]MCG8153207.1 hypothetical protein [Pimelobacter simplex]GEB14255.1 hypothetical protein NSI01_25700 [Pimelobacter simplex]SFM31854.1 hypothetical protein SAMN05421671_1163 [Pimelobacter simplex]
MRSTDISLGVAAVAMAAILTACSAASDPDEAEARPSAANSSAVPEPGATRTVEIDSQGAQIAPFGLPTLEAFLADPAVANIVIGTVTSNTVKVSKVDDSHDVFTLSDVEVEDSLKPGVKTVTFGSTGGTVKLREVRSDFEGKAGQGPFSEDELDSWVDYQAHSQGAPEVGDRVLVALTEDGGTLLHLVDSGGSFIWPSNAEPANPKWVKSLSLEDARTVIGRLSRERG